MGFNGVNIEKLNGGLGRSNPNDDNVFMLVYVVPAASLPVGVSHNVQYELLQTRDAVTRGFSPALDANADILLYHAISEFFTYAPDALLHVVLVPDELTPVQILQQAAFKNVLRSLPKVKVIGLGGLEETFVELLPLVDLIQAEINEWAFEHRLIDSVILAAKGTVAATLIANYPDFRTKAAPNVSISIAQEPAIAAIDAAYSKYADIGAVLGMLAVRKVNENLGSVNILDKPAGSRGQRDYPLSVGVRWVEASLSDGTKINSLSAADCKSLTEKGYIFAANYEGYGGLFFNSSPTCVELASDYAYIENNRVWNKAARLIRSTLLPEVKGTVKKDPATGYIRSTTISRWTDLVNAALERMQAADEISGYDVYIDPKQVLSESSPLVVKARVLVDDIVHEFNVNLGLTKEL